MQLTRSHLGALAVMTIAIAVLAFFLGFRLGRSTAPPVTVDGGPVPLVPDAAGQKDLEALLREVEDAREEAGFAFPEALTGDGEEVVGPEDAVVSNDGPVQIDAPEDDAPEAPESEAITGEVPTDGWSVQISSHADPAEAEARVEALKESKLRAYRVAALVDGETWYRVRVGAYPTQEKASEAALTLRETLGGDAELIVSKAP